MTIIDKVIAFANKLPMHKELITKRQFTGNEPTIYLNESNKDYQFSTTAIRILYSMKQTDNPHVRTLYDYNGTYDDIYLNSIDVLPQHIFGVDEHHGLDQIPNEVPVFHYRLTHYGATYYVTDDHLEDLYIALDKWVLNTRPIAKLTKKKNRKRYLETEIKELQEELNTLNKELEGWYAKAKVFTDNLESTKESKRITNKN